MHYRYKVVPFLSSIKEGASAEQAGNQLQQVIDKTVSAGWELHQVANVNIEIQPGCLGALFGAKAAWVVYNQLIFRREAYPANTPTPPESHKISGR